MASGKRADIVRLGILDTEGDETKFLATEIAKQGANTKVMDINLGAEASWADIPLREVLAADQVAMDDVFKASRRKRLIWWSGGSQKNLELHRAPYERAPRAAVGPWSVRPWRLDLCVWAFSFSLRAAIDLPLQLTMRRIAATLAVVITLPFSAGSVWADMGADPAQRGNYADGVEAYNRGDYATALQEFRPLAEQGDAKAQFNLGFMYDNGKGVPENDAKAAKWHRKAAEQDDVMAQYSLGGMYFRGEGVSQNYTEAVKWFRKAAEQGDAYAQVNLGFMYGTGEGVPMNYVKAYMWYSLAKAQGNVDAAKGLYIIEKEMNTDQIAKAQVLATEWREKHN